MKVNKIKFLGAMIFVTILMDVVPFLGFIRVGCISITNLHIPAILTSIVLGPGWGMLVGLVFGIISLMRAVSRESAVLDVLLQNPLISIVPRLLFPLLTGYLNRGLCALLKNRQALISTALSAVTGSFLNSFLVLSSLYMIYPDQFLKVLDFQDQILRNVFSTFGPNMLVEAILCVLVCTVSVCGLEKYLMKHSKNKEDFQGS